MFLQIDHQKRALLLELVEMRIREIGPEIRHCRDSEYHDKLKREKIALNEILHQLNEAEWDVTC
jgi:hypothetical protein